MNVRPSPKNARPARALALLLALVLAASEAAGQPTVLFVKGVATGQAPGAPTRFLGRGESLRPGEVVTTGARSFAILELPDDSRFTVRPDSVFTVEAYDETPERESVVVRLFRGGFRAVTGFIARRRPDAVLVNTPVATIGIRGTEFDARLCEDDCAEDARELRRVQGASRAVAVGRVVLVQGTLRATRFDGRARSVLEGAPVFQTELLETGPASQAVVVFRDGSRVSLPPETRFSIERYAFDREQPSAGSALLRLVKGGFRAVTGLIARQRPRLFGFATASATIGIRGTGLDVFCDGECAAGPAPEITEATFDAPAAVPPAGPGASCRASDDLHVSVWEGEVGVGVSGGTFALGEGDSACLEPGAGALTLLPATPGFMVDNPAPRPDEVEVDLDALFGEQAGRESQPGLFVSVREGHVRLFTADASVDLGDGETGFVDPSTGELVRLVSPPLFIEQDPYPRPGTVEPDDLAIIDLVDEALRAPGTSPLACTL